ncbi:hypothetical protein, partial [uncultured Bilophila sp.]|uniref:hypothetical protein n=1 Tax=uncultured Bilophila sp. TaxID=529385 RepID=UPI00259ACA22
MYTTKSIPLLRVVDQQKELKNIVYLPSCKTVSALFMAEPLFFMSRCILWHDESMIQYRYEHLIYYRVLKSYCFLIKKFLLYAKKPIIRKNKYEIADLNNIIKKIEKY